MMGERTDRPRLYQIAAREGKTFIGAAPLSIHVTKLAQVKNRAAEFGEASLFAEALAGGALGGVGSALQGEREGGFGLRHRLR